MSDERPADVRLIIDIGKYLDAITGLRYDGARWVREEPNTPTE
jgi:hypothetical protein